MRLSAALLARVVAAAMPAAAVAQQGPTLRVGMAAQDVGRLDPHFAVSMRFSAPAAMATPVACRPSVRERSPSPTTRFRRAASVSARARQSCPEALRGPVRPRSAMHRRCASRRVGAVPAVSLGTAPERGGTTTTASGCRFATSA